MAITITRTTSLNLRNGAQDIADRHAEYIDMRDFCLGSGKQRVLVARATRASGLTSFLRYHASLCQDSYTSVYADLKARSFSELIEEYCAADKKRFLRRLCDLTRMRYLVQILARTLSLPGPAFLSKPSCLLLADSLPNILFTPYPSATLHKFSELATCRIARRATIFFLDNGQQQPDKINELLATTFAPEYDHIRFVIGYVEKEKGCDAEFTEFLDRLRATRHSIRIMPFPSPDDMFISEYSVFRGRRMTLRDCQALHEASSGNVYRIKDALDQVLLGGEEAISPLADFMLRTLIVASSPILLSDIMVIARDSALIHYEHGEQMPNALMELCNKWIASTVLLGGGDRKVSLVSTSSPYVQRIQSKALQLLPLAKDMYDYFHAAWEVQSLRHSRSSLAPILYRLSKQVCPDEAQRWAREVVVCALAQGDISTAKQYIAESFSENGDINDNFVRVVFYISIQEYSVAWNILETMGERLCRESTTLRILMAVVLNRLRRHEESISLIDAIMKQTNGPDEIALLSSYKISGLLHEEKFEDAARVYYATRESTANAKGRGYYLRNAAACFMWLEPSKYSEAKRILIQAEREMQGRDDNYGALTCACNRGVVLAYAGKLEEARDIFDYVYKHIRIFGTQHIEESATNYGVALLLTGNTKGAYKHLTNFVGLAEEDFPRCLSENALALAEHLLGYTKQAKERIERLTEWTPGVGIKSAIYQTWLNAALMEVLTAKDCNSVNWTYIDTCFGHAAAAHSNPQRIQDRRRLLKDIQRVRKDPLKAFYWELCQHWSQNPFAMLSSISLSR